MGGSYDIATSKTASDRNISIAAAQIRMTVNLRVRFPVQS